MNITINTFEQLFDICISNNKKIYEVAQENMAQDADISEENVRTFAMKSLFAMKDAIQTGMSSKELSMSGMCGQDCHRVQRKFESQPAIFGKTFEKIIEYVKEHYRDKNIKVFAADDAINFYKKLGFKNCPTKTERELYLEV